MRATRLSSNASGLLRHLVLFAAAIAALSCRNGPLSESSTGEPLDSMEVAITIDDFPEAENLLAGVNALDASRRMLNSLKDNGVPAYAFVCGGFRGLAADTIPILKEWIRAGVPLGNHTYSHLNVSDVGAEAFVGDIARLDRVLLAVTSGLAFVQGRKMFRFPYLAEGETLEKRAAVRAWLKSNGFQIAEVTVDYQDWAWNGAYLRCSSARDAKSIAWLKAHITESAERRLRESRALAKYLFGRDIRQILLIHFSSIEDATLDATLKDLRAKGVRFISLDEALTDPVYAIDPNLAYLDGEPFLAQIAIARKESLAPFLDREYSTARLSQICK